MVMGDMYIKPGEAWEYCPREALRRVSTVLKNEFDLVYPKFIIQNSFFNTNFIFKYSKNFLSNTYILDLQIVYLLG